MFLIKGMRKVLKESLRDDYIDVLDSELAHAYEAVAYDKQMRIGDQSTPVELKRAISNYLGKNEEEVRAERNKSLDVIADREFHQLKLDGSRSYSQLLARVLIPKIANLLAQDDNELLSQFTLGILSVFECLAPQIYFVEDIDTLEKMRLGYCPFPFVKDRVPSINDTMLVPQNEVKQWFIENPHARHWVFGGTDFIRKPDEDFSQFTRSLRFWESHDYSNGMAHQIAVSQLWRNALHGICPCSYAHAHVVRCPRQKALYHEIRRFFITNDDKRLRLCNAYSALLERKVGRMISPAWRHVVYCVSKQRSVIKLGSEIIC